jgi:hypothetical protein
MPEPESNELYTYVESTAQFVHPFELNRDTPSPTDHTLAGRTSRRQFPLGLCLVGGLVSASLMWMVHHSFPQEFESSAVLAVDTGAAIVLNDVAAQFKHYRSAEIGGGSAALLRTQASVLTSPALQSEVRARVSDRVEQWTIRAEPIDGQNSRIRVTVRAGSPAQAATVVRTACETYLETVEREYNGTSRSRAHSLA